MYKQIIFFLFSLLLMISCGGDNSSSPDVENSSNSHSSEIPCDATNEGTIIKPADSDVEHICKGGSWIAIGSSSSSNNIITNETKQSSSSSSYNVILSASEESSSSFFGSETNPSSSSSSSVIASETKQSSSSGYDNDDSSSSSEDSIESSSSEETKLYLCEDGETYVLDLANCEKISSSSVVVSSSSDNTPNSSSTEVQESSSSEVSSSSVKTESSSSTIESSSSNISSSSIDESSSSEKSSSSLNDGYDAINNTLTDSRDGQIYKTVTIGSQVWMAENLNYLPKDTVSTIWAGKSVCGGGDWKSVAEGDCSIYGRLYESSFTNKPAYKKEICPTGWSLPTYQQFKKLNSLLDGNSANKMKSKNDDYWPSGNATNESGFSAIPSGFYSRSRGFNYLYSEEEKIAAFALEEYQGSNNVFWIYDTEDEVRVSGMGSSIYVAVRCIKD